MTAPLSTLTDRDLLLNVWLTVIFAIEALEIDTSSCEQTLLRDGQTPDADQGVVTLEDLMAEVESRLGVQGGLDAFTLRRPN